MSYNSMSHIAYRFFERNHINLKTAQTTQMDIASMNPIKEDFDRKMTAFVEEIIISSN